MLTRSRRRPGLRSPSLSRSRSPARVDTPISSQSSSKILARRRTRAQTAATKPLRRVPPQFRAPLVVAVPAPANVPTRVKAMRTPKPAPAPASAPAAAPQTPDAGHRQPKARAKTKSLAARTKKGGPPTTQHLIGTRVDMSSGSFVIGDVVGKGGFGTVHRITDVHLRRGPKNSPLVVKMAASDNGGLFAEMHALRKLDLGAASEKSRAAFQAAHHLDRRAPLALILYFDHAVTNIRGDMYRLLILEAFRCSMVQWLPRMSSADIVSAGTQMLHALEYVHLHGYAHGDIKAENICTNGDGRYVLIDFGSADHFALKGTVTDVSMDTDAWVPYAVRCKNGVNGTLLFASLDGHVCASCTPRSDLETLAYNILWWVGPALPWTSLVSPHDVDKAKKQYNTASGAQGAVLAQAIQGARALCAASFTPGSSSAHVTPLVMFIAGIFQLPYHAWPHYGHLRELLHQCGPHLPCTRYSPEMIGPQVDTHQ